MVAAVAAAAVVAVAAAAAAAAGVVVDRRLRGAAKLAEAGRRHHTWAGADRRHARLCGQAQKLASGRKRE